MRALLLGVLAAACVPLPALADMVSLYGITLGAPLSLKECTAGYSPNRTDAKACYLQNDNRDPSLAIYAVPVTTRPHYFSDGDYGNLLWLDANHKVQSISIDVRAQYHDDTIAALKKKFGASTRTGKPYGEFGGIRIDKKSDPVFSKYEWDVSGAVLTYIPHTDGQEGEILLETPEGTRIRDAFNPAPAKLTP